MGGAAIVGILGLVYWKRDSLPFRNGGNQQFSGGNPPIGDYTPTTGSLAIYVPSSSNALNDRIFVG